MRFDVRTSGGIGNLRISASIDTAALNGALADRASGVTPQRLAAAAIDASNEASYPDQRSFEVRFPGGRSYLVPDTAADTELVELLDELVTDFAARTLRQREAPSGD